MTTTETRRILLAEDDPAVAKGLVYGLEEEGYEVRWTADGRTALTECESFDPHLALLDIRLPVLSGLEICRRIRERGHKIPIIMVTARDRETDRIVGLEMGADDYVVKPFSLRELCSRVRSQLRRAYGEYSDIESSARKSFGEVTVDLRRLRAFRGGRELYLTPMEFKLLSALLDNEGIPLNRDVLIEKVWGDSISLEDPRTVDVHIRHLREKVETDPSSPRYILTVRGFGYKFESRGGEPPSI